MRVWHVPVCVKIPPKVSVARIMGYGKGKSSLRIFESFPHLRCKFGKRRFRCTGYVVSTVGVNEATIIKHVREQEERDKITDQYSLVERPVSSFTGSRATTPYRVKSNSLLKGRS